MPRIGIIDYGIGNLHSVKNAFDYIGCDAFVSSDAKELERSDGILLPGVGAFPDGMRALVNTGLADLVKSEAAIGKPLLGICLGMQLLFDVSYEFEECSGLGLISGSVERMKACDTDKRYKLPHIGWNTLEFVRTSPLCKDITAEKQVYFVHSYYAVMPSDDDLIAYTEYGERVTAIVGKGNVFGTQFHPEKSGKVGLEMLKGFAEFCK